MKNYKLIYHVLLTLCTMIVLYFRRTTLLSDSPPSVDTILLTLTIGLMIIPLFKEISIGSISFKKDIENVKTELNEKINEVKNEINNKLEFSPTINIGEQQAIEKSLKELKDDFPQVIEESFEGYVSRNIKQIHPLQIEERTLFMISIRYNLEKVLRDIWSHYAHNDSKWPTTVHYIASNLHNKGIIGSTMTKHIKDIYNITSPAIHAQEVNDVELSLVYKLAPKVIESLKLEETKIKKEPTHNSTSHNTA